MKAVRLLFTSKTKMVKPAAVTLVMFVVGNFQFYLLFLAFDLRPPVVDFILAGSLLGLLGMIPSSVPAKIGQFETFGVLTLPHLLNIDKNAVFSLLLLQRSISIIVIFILGFVSLNILKLDWESLKSISLKAKWSLTKKEDK